MSNHERQDEHEMEPAKGQFLVYQAEERNKIMIKHLPYFSWFKNICIAPCPFTPENGGL